MRPVMTTTTTLGCGIGLHMGGVGVRCLRGTAARLEGAAISSNSSSNSNSNSNSRFRRCAIGNGFVQRRFKSGPYGYTQAKALVYSKYGEPGDVLSLHTHSISPSLPPSTLLLRALASPINPADMNQIQGTYPSKPPLTSLLGTATPSAVGGNEGVFEVLAVAHSSSSSESTSTTSGDTPIQKGDWVLPALTNFGTWRTHATASVKDVIRIDKTGLTPLQAALVSINPCTAYRMLRDYQPVTAESGDWFIQNGANSGVGRAAVQMGKRWGVGSINVIRSRGEGKEAETEKLRSELVELGGGDARCKVVTEEEILDRGFRDRVKAWVGEGRLRLGLNCVGGKPTQAMIKCLDSGGELVTYGGMGRAPLQVSTSSLIFKDYRFSGFWMGRWAKREREEKRRMIAEILGWMREGEFRDVPVVKRRWDWETGVEELKGAVEGTLGGFRGGKGVFVFGGT